MSNKTDEHYIRINVNAQNTVQCLQALQLNLDDADRKAVERRYKKLKAAGPQPIPVVLNDLSPMPWGKHKGTPMQDVPASYLHYLWTEHHFQDNDNHELSDYIRTNLESLKEEYPNGIW